MSKTSAQQALETMSDNPAWVEENWQTIRTILAAHDKMKAALEGYYEHPLNKTHSIGLAKERIAAREALALAEAAKGDV
jgi:hypothetical protein